MDDLITTVGSALDRSQKQFLTILRLKRQKKSPLRQSLWKTPRRQVRRPAAGKNGKRTSRPSTKRGS